MSYVPEPEHCLPPWWCIGGPLHGKKVTRDASCCEFIYAGDYEDDPLDEAIAIRDARECESNDPVREVMSLAEPFRPRKRTTTRYRREHVIDYRHTKTRICPGRPMIHRVFVAEDIDNSDIVSKLQVLNYPKPDCHGD